MLNHAIQTAVRPRQVETPLQKRVLQALATLADEHGEIHYSLAEICSRAQCSENSVMKALHQLADLGEIAIHSGKRQRGNYHINDLPADKKPKIDSIRSEIVNQIRLLPLPVRISVIFQALASYASRTGNNIFPSEATIARDTGYSSRVVRETVKWLIEVEMLALDADCINPKYQARKGYKIPGWNRQAGLLTITEEQISQIKQLYQSRHRSYYGIPSAAGASEISLDQALDEVWPEREEMDDHKEVQPLPEIEEEQLLGNEIDENEAILTEIWPEAEDQEEVWSLSEVGEEEQPLAREGDEGENPEEEESQIQPPVSKDTGKWDQQQLVPHYPDVVQRLGPLPPQTLYIRLNNNNQKVKKEPTISLVVYNQAVDQVKRQHDILATSTDPSQRAKAEAIIKFYQTMIERYELHFQQRE